MLHKEDFEHIGTLGRAHGIQGEVAAKLSIDLSGLWEQGGANSLFLMLKERELISPYPVLGLRSKGGDIDLLTLSGITTKEAADQLSGRSVWLDKAYLEDEEAGDLIDLHHFVGYELYDAQQGTLVGAITALDDTTLNTLLRVEPPSGGELIVPIADELIEHVEVGAHRLYLFIPDGLLEL